MLIIQKRYPSVDEQPTDRLDDTTIMGEAKYFVNVTNS